MDYDMIFWSAIGKVAIIGYLAYHFTEMLKAARKVKPKR